MARVKSGILGGFSGKVGNVVGGSWKGIDYMRVKSASVSNPRTPAQLAQRGKLSTTVKMLQPITEFVRVGFKQQAKRMSAFNYAVSENIASVVGTHPNFSVDFNSVLVSKGNLHGVEIATATSTIANNLEFSWQDNSGLGNAQSSDKALLLAYNAARIEAVFILGGPERYTQAATLNLPVQYSGESVEVFLAFINSEGTKISTSQYLGSIVVA